MGRPRLDRRGAFALAVAAPALVFVGLAFIISAAFPQALWLAYLLVGLGFLYVAGFLVIGGGWYVMHATSRALAHRRNRRIARHNDTALAHLTDPCAEATQVIQLGAAETQVLARYEREVADLSNFYVFPGDFR